MGRLRYTDEDRALTLAALDANGGNVSLTSKQTGVPRKTLEEWANGRVGPAVPLLRQEKRLPLADGIEDLAYRILGGITDAKIAEATLQQAVTSLGIAVDKVMALRGLSQPKAGGPTALSDDDLERRLADAEAALARTRRGEGAAAG